MWVGYFFLCWLAYLWLEACRDDDDSRHDNISSRDDDAFGFYDIDTSDTSNFNIDPIADQQHDMIYNNHDE